MTPESILQDEERQIISRRNAIATLSDHGVAREQAVQLEECLRIIHDVRGLFQDLRAEKARLA